MEISDFNYYKPDEIYQCEYLVVGSGAGGATAAQVLSSSGKDVLIVEEGKNFQRKDFSTNVSVMTAKLYRNAGIFPFLGAPAIAFAEGRCVGGSTVINGGLIWRTPSWILEEWRTNTGINLHEESLRPYFEKIEADLSVMKAPLSTDANLDSNALWEAAQALNWKAVLVPRAIKNCINENNCSIGCISGGKQSMIETYIPKSIAQGARLFSEAKVVRLSEKSDGVYAEVVSRGNSEEKKFRIAAKQVILAAGAVYTPYLLRKSGLSSKAGSKLEFHVNLKFIVKNKRLLNAEKGTIFTVQVQEFERDGILMMPANLKPSYLAMTVSQFGNDAINSLLRDYDRCGLYTTMVRMRSKAKVISKINQPVVVYEFNSEDLKKIRIALEKSVQILLESGAEEIYLPVIKTKPIRSLADLKTAMANLTPKDLELVSVHAMASAWMGTSRENSVINPDGGVWNHPRVHVMDASALPSNIGESPQGSIMAISYLNAEKLAHAS